MPLFLEGINMYNNIILIGRIKKINKTKGIVNHFHLEIERTEKGVYDSPIVHLPKELQTATTFIKEDNMIAVKGHFETVIRGGYGTVTSIVADRLTYLEQGVI
jgi:hypothetical protein